MIDNREKSTTVSNVSKKIVLFRDIAILLLLMVIAVKIALADIKIDFQEFSYKDLLALLLAIFSVWLSAAFYFKATDTSNRFYDNSYRFAKEMSEILGRIEAGFGERLRHLDEGYSGMAERFDKLPAYLGQRDPEIQDEKKFIREKEKEQHKLIEDLAARAQLAEDEKKQLFKNLSSTSRELEHAKEELASLKHSDFRMQQQSDRRRLVLRFLAKEIAAQFPGNMVISPEVIMERFCEIKDSLPRAALRDLDRFQLLTDSGGLTRDAALRVYLFTKRLRPPLSKLE